MTQYFLSGIRVEGFRGINNENQPLKLGFKKDSVNSVFAHNGTGKSSLFEALNYAVRGVVPKLNRLQADEHPENYLTNLFHSGSIATIWMELEDDAGGKIEIEVQRAANGARTVSSRSPGVDPNAVLRQLDEDFTLLDYAAFSQFVEDTPLQRGRSFASLLGLSQYSRTRLALEALSSTRNLNGDFDLPTLEATAKATEDRAAAALTHLSSSIQALTGTPIGDVTNVASVGERIRAVLAEIPLFQSAIEGKRLSEIDFEGLRTIIATAEGQPTKSELSHILARVGRLQGYTQEALSSCEAEIASTRSKIQARDDLLKETQGERFRRLHISAKELISAGEWSDESRCPLCDSQLSDEISNHVASSLAAYENIDGLNQEINLLVLGSRWLSLLEQLEATPELEVPLSARKAATLRSIAGRGELNGSDVDAAISTIGELLEGVGSKLALLQTRRLEIEKSLPPSLVALATQLEHARQATGQLTTYWKASNEGQQAKVKLARYEAWVEFVTDACGAYQSAEAALTKARLEDIETEYQAMFANVMGVGDIVPKLVRDDTKERLDVRLSDFHGRTNVSARALLSESFRNALAISIFLSAALKHKGAPRFVVLDDVTSSFDAGHQWQLMEHIRTKMQYGPNRLAGLQFIVLSHDGLLEKYFDRVGAGNGWNHQRLQGLPPLGAITIVGQSADRLRDAAKSFLTAGQVKEAEPLIRQYLEFKLVQVINKVQIPVPYDFAMKESQQMVSNCLTAITDAIELHAKAGTLVLDSQQVADLQGQHVPAIVGNWLSHYATAVGASVSPYVMLNVLQSVDDLVDCFRWTDTSGAAPVQRFYKSLSKKK